MSNIIMIGMPASGKSTVGVLLAKNLGYRFLDCDLLIQEREGKLLHEIIEERGVEGFLELENRVCSTIEADRTVISTGGSAVYGEEGMAHLKTLGKVLYLKIDYDTLVKRLGDYSHRGVVSPNATTLEELFAERTPLYEKYADLVVDEADTEGDLTQTVSRCLALFK